MPTQMHANYKNINRTEKKYAVKMEQLLAGNFYPWKNVSKIKRNQFKKLKDAHCLVDIKVKLNLVFFLLTAN